MHCLENLAHVRSTNTTEDRSFYKGAKLFLHTKCILGIIRLCMGPKDFFLCSAHDVGPNLLDFQATAFVHSAMLSTRLGGLPLNTFFQFIYKILLCCHMNENLHNTETNLYLEFSYCLHANAESDCMHDHMQM